MAELPPADRPPAEAGFPEFVTRDRIIQALAVLGIDAAQVRAMTISLTQIAVEHPRVMPNSDKSRRSPELIWTVTQIPVWEADGSLIDGPRSRG